MTPGRPSKEEREAWADLRGEEHRTARRWGARLFLIPLLAILIAVPVLLARGAGYVGGCPSAEEMTAFWAQDAASVSSKDRDRQIRLGLRCIDFEGLTRAQVMEQLGVWTTVEEYPVARSSRKGAYYVWSNGSDTPGIGVEFTGPNGRIVAVGRYDP